MQGGAARDSEAGGSQQGQKKQKKKDHSPATRTAKAQFQTFCSEETVASNRLHEGDGVEYKRGGRERSGTVRFWGEGNAWAIVDGQGSIFDDPLVWLFETEDGAYPKDNERARIATVSQRRSIFFTRDGKERWCPFTTIPTPKDPCKSPPAAGSTAGSSDESSGNGGASSSLKQMPGGGSAQVYPPPLGPLGFDFAHHNPTTRPFVEMICTPGAIDCDIRKVPSGPHHVVAAEYVANPNHLSTVSDIDRH